MIRPFPPSRRLVTAAVRAGRRIMPMHGLFDVDISTAKRRLGDHDPPLSFTAFVIATLARAAAVHPEVHAYRDWRGRLVQHRHVDVQTLVEVPTGGGQFGLVHVVRDADIRSVADISDEIRAVSTDATSTRGGRLLQTLAPSLGRIPGLYRAMYAAMSRSRRVHLASGTVQVTAVGMFADGAGYAIAPATLASLSLVVGGISRRPRAVGDHIEVRDVLDLTLTIDHNVVDGGPATRFATDLRHLLHTAAALPRKQTHLRDETGTEPAHLLRVAEASFSGGGPLPASYTARSSVIVVETTRCSSCCWSSRHACAVWWTVQMAAHCSARRTSRCSAWASASVTDRISSAGW